MKNIYLIIGAIGSGKSSLVKELFLHRSIDFVSSDIYKKMFFDNNEALAASYAKADMLAEYKLEVNCKKNVDFIYELCPTNSDKINLILDLKTKYNYKLTSFVVWTENVEINIQRNENRYKNEKGDFVSKEKVISRYQIAFDNLPELIIQSNDVYFIDNSEYLIPIAYLSENNLHTFNNASWFDDNLKNLIKI